MTAAPPAAPPAARPIAVEDAERLRRVAGALNRRLRVSAPGGLTPSQLTCLATVCKHGPLRAGDLAAREALNPTSLSRIVGRLEELGYLTRTPDPADRRGALLASTASGRRTQAKVEQQRTALLQGALGQLAPDQVAAVQSALPALEQLVAALPSTSVGGLR